MALLDWLAGAPLALTLPGTAYLATLSLAGVLPVRSPRLDPAQAEQAAALRVAFIVPAHNESTGLLRTLRSLQAEAARCPHTRIVVVADNCTDDTAQVAHSAGVEVLERQSDTLRGKGHALGFAFDAVQAADWFIVIDADTDVTPGFLTAMRAAMARGAQALQCRYGVRDPLDSRRATLADVALGAWNVLRPRGRSQFGLSAGIFGNGFALSRATLAQVPYTATSIVEDVEYHQMLVRAGLRVQWVDGAEVRGDMPGESAAAGQQRARWEGGRLRLILDRLPLLAADVLRGHWRLLDPLLDLCLLPLAWHVSLILLGMALAALAGVVPLLALAGTSLAVVVAHVLIAMPVMRASAAHWRALASVPGYLVWKLALLGGTLRAARRHAQWVRSKRNPSA
jgi:cellulose synthase/poly-beta-1,6-N-acetylglucosamine synthase-like glycosyltransferase